MRVVLDTNIYISAVLFGGKPRDIINLVRNKKIELLISDYILWEIREVLNNKFSVPDTRLNIIEHDILSMSQIIAPHSNVKVIIDHRADNAIINCAIDGDASIIITGDKHLLKLKTYGRIKILTPNAFLTLCKS